jgi:hypothetical protein
MSAKQFGRKIILTVADSAGNALDLSAFRITFNVRRGDFQNPNSADVRIYNLANNTATKIRNEYTKITLSAGYQSNLGLIFQGTIKQTRLGRIDQKDSYVDITAADSDGIYNYSTMAVSLAAGNLPTNAVSIMLQSMAKAAADEQNVYGTMEPIVTAAGLMGYQPGFEPVASLRGRVFYGMTRDELRDFAKTNNCSWSIQDGKIVFIPLNNYIPGEAYVISPTSGLIGIPEQTQAGINMRILLNANIKVGATVQLEYSIVNSLRLGLDFNSGGSNPGGENAVLLQQIKVSRYGLYYVMVANHSGDTRGNTWYTDLTCLSVDASITQDNTSQVSTLPDDGYGPIQVN